LSGGLRRAAGSPGDAAARYVLAREPFTGSWVPFASVMRTRSWSSPLR